LQNTPPKPTEIIYVRPPAQGIGDAVNFGMVSYSGGLNQETITTPIFDGLTGGANVTITPPPVGGGGSNSPKKYVIERVVIAGIWLKQTAGNYVWVPSSKFDESMKNAIRLSYNPNFDANSSVPGSNVYRMVNFISSENPIGTAEHAVTANYGRTKLQAGTLYSIEDYNVVSPATSTEAGASNGQIGEPTSVFPSVKHGEPL
tara:strand:+ start:2980 stop:3585 length:606 start_codon:yes stop_codon:yes gene_type:complete